MHTRIPVFVAQAHLNGMDADAIHAHCEEELAFLYGQRQTNGSPYTDNHVKHQITEYRRTLQQEDVQGWPLYKVWLKEPDGKRQARDGAYRQQVISRAHDKIDIPLSQFHQLVNKAEALIDRPGYSPLTLGLSLLTGRRMFEVLVCGDIEPLPDTTTHISFRGQAKTVGRHEVWMALPVLIDNARVVDAWHALRHAHNFTRFAPTYVGADKATYSAFHDATNKTIYEAFQSHFRTLMPQWKATVHDLRKIYAAAMWHFDGKPRGKDQAFYFSEIMGHQPGDSDITGGTYRKFNIVED